jgi:hypothetical protein
MRYYIDSQSVGHRLGICHAYYYLRRHILFDICKCRGNGKQNNIKSNLLIYWAAINKAKERVTAKTNNNTQKAQTSHPGLPNQLDTLDTCNGRRNPKSHLVPKAVYIRCRRLQSNIPVATDAALTQTPTQTSVVQQLQSIHCRCIQNPREFETGWDPLSFGFSGAYDRRWFRSTILHDA